MKGFGRRKRSPAREKKLAFAACSFKIYVFLCCGLVILILASDFYYKFLLLYESTFVNSLLFESTTSLIITIQRVFFILFILLFHFMNMYVGNLNYRVKEGDLEQVMAAYGEVNSVKVIKDRETGKSKGFAFVEMKNDEEAAQAMKELNGSELMGRQMVIKGARPRD